MWDYKTLKFSTECGFWNGTQFNETVLEAELKAWGQQGWELVSIFDIEKVKGGSKFVVAVLKKRIS